MLNTFAKPVSLCLDTRQLLLSKHLSLKSVKKKLLEKKSNAEMDDAPNISAKYVIDQSGIFSSSMLMEKKHFVES